MKKENNYYLKIFTEYDYLNSYKCVRRIKNLWINEDKMTEIFINYKWNEVIIQHSKIMSLKNNEYGKVSFMLQVKNKKDEYDYISLKSLPYDTKINFNYDDDRIRISFANNADIQDFIKENEYFLKDFKISELMTEPLYKKENY